MHNILCYVSIFVWKVGDLYLVNPERVPYRSPTYLCYSCFCNILFLVYYSVIFPYFYIDKEKKLHKPVRRRFDKRTVFAKQVDDIWIADLVDMSPFSK